MSEKDDLMQKIVSLCKRRGFVFQSSEIYGGLKSAYDYGPLGVELKRNLMSLWWREMVHSREDVVGLDASIMMHPKVWQASGHLAGFSDPLVDCLICKERFRADKAPRKKENEALTLVFADKDRAKTAATWLEQNQAGLAFERQGKEITGIVAGNRGYVCPVCQSPFLSGERQFNLMFRSHIGPVDPIGSLAQNIASGDFNGLSADEIRQRLDQITREGAIYLRPETAQAMFVQFDNILTSMSMKVPFGIAQMGKSFRNEITTEHFIFRSCEFEQMEMEFFCEPGTDDEWMNYWVEARMNWWKKWANDPSKFVARPHEPEELAHYAKACFDIEYEYPWGFGELEGIANRTDYDLKKHAEYSNKKLSYFDQANNKRYVPYVIEPAAGATRGVLVYLLDAYCEEKLESGDTRVVMKFHPQLAPIKVAVLPLVKKEGMPEKARSLVDAFFKRGISASLDVQQSIGHRYRRHDEIGTPWCLTIDGQTMEDNTITIRDRDTMAQKRISIEDAIHEIETRLRESLG
jgi:glycyl-tRNA synthetase